MKDWMPIKKSLFSEPPGRLALSRFLADQGARVVLTDLHGPEALSAEALTLKDAGVGALPGLAPVGTA